MTSRHHLGYPRYQTWIFGHTAARRFGQGQLDAFDLRNMGPDVWYGTIYEISVV